MKKGGGAGFIAPDTAKVPHEKMPGKYRTVFRPAVVEIVEKKSRFIASVIPVVDGLVWEEPLPITALSDPALLLPNEPEPAPDTLLEETVQKFLLHMRKNHYKASHNVFAYTVGLSKSTERMSDDGEPGGTAGMPVLDIIRNEGLKNVAVNVTRYFGGTLLGTGGLVRAYGKAAKEGLRAALIVEKVLCRKLSVTVEYPLAGKVQAETLQDGHTILDTIYTDRVEFIVLTEAGLEERYHAGIIDATGARAEIRQGDMGYFLCRAVNGNV